MYNYGTGAAAPAANNLRQFPLGFPVTSMATTVTATITAQPQVTFRGRRLIIPSDFAGSILVEDIKIGKNSQFPGSGPVPGRCFSEQAVGVDLQLDTAQVSQLVSLLVQNTSGGTVSFSAALFGDAVNS